MKMIAAVAAVMRYIRDEEDAVAAAMAAAAPEPPPQPADTKCVGHQRAARPMMEMRNDANESLSCRPCGRRPH
jgi:hypothetical protein